MNDSLSCQQKKQEKEENMWANPVFDSKEHKIHVLVIQ